MGVSMLELQRDSIIQAIKDASQGQWKVLVVDEESWKLISSVVKEDEILSNKIMNIEHIEQKRATQRDSDAIYLLTPEPHVVDCVLADMERRRYNKISLLWTSILLPELQARIQKSPMARDQLVQLRVIDVGYFPREAQLVTFRDPWSFPILYHPGCNHLVRRHMASLAQKIVSVCVSLGEYPTIRYYKPANASHDAAVLCEHLARFVQGEIDKYATFHQDFPPQTNRPRATLYILDRSVDVVAPVVHEFTYQAMVYDLLQVKDGEKVTYHITINEGRPDQEEKDAEISDKDKIWTSNRHQHMKDTIDKLMGEFQRFMDENPHFTKADANSSNSLNAIKDMMAGLPEFQELKEAYSLHLTMAQECMNIFQKRKLADLGSIEQSLATGLDEDYKKPKNLADQVVRSLDDESVSTQDRLRLVILYLLHRDGLLPADIVKLLAHANLSQPEGEIIRNLGNLGVRTNRQLKDPRPLATPLFPVKPPPMNAAEDNYSLSRFQPAVKHLLEKHARNELPQDSFPYTKPQLDHADGSMEPLAHTSLRSTAKPSWAKSRGAATQAPRQRVLVFMAGGATFSEARACYEASDETARDVYMITSHMLSPSFFLRQVLDLSADRRVLRLPMEAPAKKPPAHLFEPEHPPPQQQQQQQPQQHQPQKHKPQQPPAAQMANMRLDPGGNRNGHLSAPYAQAPGAPTSSSRPNSAHDGGGGGGGGGGKEKEKKKHRFGFGLRS